MSTSRNSSYHHGNLRQVLLTAALRILERKGHAALGLRDLARAVGVSPAAPYRHFDSRAALLEALAVTGFQRFTAAMEEAGQNGDGDSLGAMGRAYVEFALANANLFRLMFSPELKKDARPGLRMAADAAFETLLRVSGGEGEEARLRALAAWAKVHGLATLLLDGQIALPQGEDRDALIAGVIASL